MKKNLLSFILTLSLTAGFCQLTPLTGRIFRATSSDGINWVKDPKVLLDSVNTPLAIKDTNGIILLYHVYSWDSIAYETNIQVATSTDGQNFSASEKVVVCCTGAHAKLTPEIVLLPDGSMNMYFIDGDDTIPEQIYYATSDDSIQFVGEAPLCFTKTNITYPDIFYVNNTWVMFASLGTSLIRATSPDGVTFTEDNTFVWNQANISSTFLFPGNIYRTYFSTNDGIKSATSTDGYYLTMEAGIRLQPGTHEVISEPTIVQLATNSYVMYYKSEISSTGIEENKSTVSVSISPNPFSESATLRIINVSGLQTDDLKIKFYNVIGKEIFPAITHAPIGIGTNSFVINRNGLASGVYFYSVLSKGKNLANGKLIVD